MNNSLDMEDKPLSMPESKKMRNKNNRYGKSQTTKHKEIKMMDQSSITD